MGTGRVQMKTMDEWMDRWVERRRSRELDVGLA